MVSKKTRTKQKKKTKLEKMEGKKYLKYILKQE